MNGHETSKGSKNPTRFIGGSVKKDTAFWELWQTSMLGNFYYCFKCIAACPVGAKSRK